MMAGSNALGPDEELEAVSSDLSVSTQAQSEAWSTAARLKREYEQALYTAESMDKRVTDLRRKRDGLLGRARNAAGHVEVVRPS
jgi:hypothetical protein